MIVKISNIKSKTKEKGDFFMKKITSIIIATIIAIMLMTTFVSAETIQVVNSNQDKVLKNNEIAFTKKILEYNQETKEFIIELDVKNIEEQEDLELVIVLDDSGSMTTIEGDKTRKQFICDTASEFITKIFGSINHLKVGIVKFSNSAVNISELSDNKNELLSKLDEFSKTSAYGDTYMLNAFNRAEMNFSSNASNKIIVFFSDGQPSDNAEQIRKKLINLEENGILVNSIILGNNTNVFGTESNPTAGSVYYVNNITDTEGIFNDIIYNSIVNYMKHPITNLSIEDVFPKFILDYFNIECIDAPTKGTISEGSAGNSLVWNIDKLEMGEEAKVRYKITLKENVDVSSWKDLELTTNEQVILSYLTHENNTITENFVDNPSIKIVDDVNTNGGQTPTPGTSNGNNNSNNNNKLPSTGDNTTAKGKVPQTGLQTTFIVIGVIALVATSAIVIKIVDKKTKIK